MCLPFVPFLHLADHLGWCIYEVISIIENDCIWRIRHASLAYKNMKTLHVEYDLSIE